MTARELPLEPGCIAVVRPNYGDPATVGCIVELVKRVPKGTTLLAPPQSYSATSRAWHVTGHIRSTAGGGRIVIVREALINPSCLRRINGLPSDLAQDTKVEVKKSRYITPSEGTSMTTRLTLVIPNYDEFSDLLAWAGEPEHCNGNVQVAPFLEQELRNRREQLAAGLPARVEVPDHLATDVEELVNDWSDMMAASHEGTGSYTISTGDTR